MASFKDKFVEELDYLRRLGRLFARGNPGLEPFLGSSAKDPDVERLLEGFAFLNARLRLKIEDDFPEITQPLLQARDPICLQPSPSMTIMRFTPLEGALSAPHPVPRGTVVHSRLIDGVRCPFRTCTEVTLLPLAIASISDSHSNGSSIVRVVLEATPGASLHNLDCDHLEFHLSGSDDSAWLLYGWLGRHLQGMRMHCNDLERTLPPHNLQFCGFDPQDALLPQAAGKLDGYRILQEYFCYPTRFLFFRLTGLRSLWPSAPCQRVTLEFRFDRPMPPGSRVQTGDLSLFCTPAINLFPGVSQTISLDEPRLKVPLLPAGRRQGTPWTLFSVDGVSLARRSAKGEGRSPIPTLRPFSSASLSPPEREEGFYLHDVCDSLVPEGVAHCISFLRADRAAYVVADGIVQANLTCSNGQLPASLLPGDITHQADTTTTLATFTNLTAPTPAHLPELGGDHQWSWISNLTPNFLTLTSVPALVAFLRAYDLPAIRNIQLARETERKLGAIRSISTTPIDRMFREWPVRGSLSHLELDPSAFHSEGEMHLLFSVISHTLAVFFSTRSFHVLSIASAPGEEPYQWPIRLGTQPLM